MSVTVSTVNDPRRHLAALEAELAARAARASELFDRLRAFNLTDPEDQRREIDRLRALEVKLQARIEYLRPSLKGLQDKYYELTRQVAWERRRAR